MFVKALFTVSAVVTITPAVSFVVVSDDPVPSPVLPAFSFSSYSTYVSRVSDKVLTERTSTLSLQLNQIRSNKTLFLHLLVLRKYGLERSHSLRTLKLSLQVYVMNYYPRNDVHRNGIPYLIFDELLLFPDRKNLYHHNLNPYKRFHLKLYASPRI